jgi:hypothetical protein
VRGKNAVEDEGHGLGGSVSTSMATSIENMVGWKEALTHEGEMKSHLDSKSVVGEEK